MSRPSRIRRAISRPALAWTGFWFTPQDALSLGVCRVLVGAMMLYAHIVWGLNLEGFFGPDGWQSTEAVRSLFAEDWLPSLWWYVPADQLRLVHLLCLVPLVMFILGIATPVSSVLALAITISNSNRAPLANYGMDQILTMLGLYLVIGGCGARFSLDAWWRRRRTARRGRPDWRSAPTSRARLGTRLIQVHYCIIYFFAAISKLQGDAWWNGEAVWMAFANQEYQSIDMTWLAYYPRVTQIATHGTVLWELSFPFLVWNRTLRPYVLAVGIAMHAGIGLCMGMITFGLIAIFGYLAFVPPARMQRLIDTRLGMVRRRRPWREHESPFVAYVEPDTDSRLELAAESSIDRTEVSTSTSDRGPSPLAPAADETAVGDADTDEIDVNEVGADNAATPIAICDPGWKQRQFAHYLKRRGFQPHVTASPRRLWCLVEGEDLSAAVLFVDPLSSEEFALLLDDLTLSPVSQLPLVIVSRHQSRLSRAEQLECPHLVTTGLPASCRELRQALQQVLRQSPREDAVPPRERSANGHRPVQSPAGPDTSPPPHTAEPL